MKPRQILARCLVVVAASTLLGCGTAYQSPVAASKFALRVNCGADKQYVDKAGNAWLADQYMMAGRKWGAEDGETVIRDPAEIPGVDAPQVYLTERYSLSGYQFLVPSGKYCVRLHFAETYEGITGAGQRLFGVTINGEKVLEDFDPYKEAGGSLKAVVKTFRGVKPVGGKIAIGFISNIQNPEINGIEIIGE